MKSCIDQEKGSTEDNKDSTWRKKRSRVTETKGREVLRTTKTVEARRKKAVAVELQKLREEKY